MRLLVCRCVLFRKNIDNFHDKSSTFYFSHSNRVHSDTYIDVRIYSIKEISSFFFLFVPLCISRLFMVTITLIRTINGKIEVCLWVWFFFHLFFKSQFPWSSIYIRENGNKKFCPSMNMNRLIRFFFPYRPKFIIHTLHLLLFFYSKKIKGKIAMHFIIFNLISTEFCFVLLSDAVCSTLRLHSMV